MKSKKKKTGANELIYKPEIELQMEKTIMRLPGEKGGGINWEWHMHTTIYKTHNQ